MPETRKRKAATRKAPGRKRTAPAKKRAAPRKATRARVVSAAQKTAMAEGRSQSRTVRSYLEALDDINGPKRRGRRRTPEQINQRLVTIGLKMREVNPLERVKLAQEKRDLEADLASRNGASTVDLDALEKEFVKVAKPFGDRQGITYGAWRDVGVPAIVLSSAGIKR